MPSVLQLREAESRGRLSNRWRTQEHRDSSPQGDRSSTKLAAVLGVVEAETREPEQLPAERKGLDRDKPARDTNTKRHLRSTTSRAEARASRDTSARRAKRRYRARESPRANQVSVEQIQAVPQPTIQKAAEPKLFFSLLLISLENFWTYPRQPLGLSNKSYLPYSTPQHRKSFLDIGLFDPRRFQINSRTATNMPTSYRLDAAMRELCAMVIAT